jgi:Family of unknown function (DUF6544)
MNLTDREAGESLTPEMVADLPDLARRYFLHAIRSGTPLAHSARLEMIGDIRLGLHLPWMSLRAREMLVPPEGFVWEARIGRWGVRFVGADSYRHGQGRTQFRLWDCIPIVCATGPDVSRSARGRLANESIWNPASLLPQRGVVWTAIDDETAQAMLTIDGERFPLSLTIAPDGSLQSVKAERWGNLTADGRFAAIPFGADIFDEATFGGYTVPSHVAVNWWHGDDREFHFFTAQVTQAAFASLDSLIDGPVNAARPVVTGDSRKPGQMSGRHALSRVDNEIGRTR